MSGEFSSDTPTSDPKADAFSRYPFAKRVADIVKNRGSGPSTVIGIYGAWGEGKTTVLEYVRGELDGIGNISVMPFNPWRFAGDEQLLLSFFSTLSEVLATPLKTKAENVAGWISEYGELIIPSIELAWGAAKIDPSKGTVKAAERFSNVKLDTLKSRIEKALNEAKQRVLVIMDDIDRLDRDEVHQVFKLVKLTGNFKNVDYLLAFDDTAIAAALGNRYGEGNLEAGRDYLEKIIQIPLRLPAASEAALRKFYFTALNNVFRDTQIALTDEQANSFATTFATGFRVDLTTPRMALRYANVVRFGLPIIQAETNAVDFMLLEAVKLFYPRVYQTIRNKGFEVVELDVNAQGEKDKVREWVNEALTSVPKLERDGASEVIRFLFPQLQSIFANFYFGAETHEEWAEARRLCTKEYFFRYFSYAVAPDDISDSEIGSLIRDRSPGVQQIADRIRGLVSRQNAESFLAKLWRRVNELEPEFTERLALALAKCGDLFPDSGGMFGFTSSGEAAKLIDRMLIRRIAKRQRAATGIAIIRDAEPLYLAFECLRMFRPSEEQPPAESVFDDTSSRKACRQLAARVKDELSRELPWRRYPDSFFRLLRLWARERSKSETQRALRKWFAAEPAAVLDFLEGVTGKAYPLGSNVGRSQDFEQEHLAVLDQVVDLDLVYRFVVKASACAVNLSDYHKAPNEPRRERIAAQFAWLHRNITQKQPQSEQ